MMAESQPLDGWLFLSDFSIGIHNIDFRIPISRGNECNLRFVVRGESFSQQHADTRQTDAQPCKQ